MILIGSKSFSKYFDNCILLQPNADLALPVATHPDMNVCIIDNTVFLPSNSPYEKAFKDAGYDVKCINEKLSDTYPNDVFLNCKVIKNTVILNEKTVSKDILNYCKISGKTIINVPQGYAGCSLLALSETAFITSDKGIYKELLNHGYFPLLIKEGYIDIDEYNYGFIGGASAFIGGVLFFFGDITKHPDYLKIDKYLSENNVKYKYFDCSLKDIGSAIEF